MTGKAAAEGQGKGPPGSGHGKLQRDVGVLGAMLLGLGSIVGTGVFVSIAVAAEAAGPAVVLAIVLAAGVATCNGLSSAQLAANHPVSGGTYEYGYHYLKPWLGFTAGWTFLLAKSASAATAALGFAGYGLDAVGVEQRWLVPAALLAVLVLTAVVYGGIRRSNRVNAVIVLVTLSSLALFVLAGADDAWRAGAENLRPFLPTSWRGLLEATALMFVAYTGYGRIATLGEEVTEPLRNIPRAIIATLVVSALLYLAVGVVAIGAVGAPAFAAAGTEEVAPLEVVARGFGVPGLSWILAVGAVTALLGVLLNLLLGLSRVLLAMGRRGDAPALFAGVHDGSPRAAVLGVGITIAALTLLGDVKTTWSFSAFTVLVYYALTNLAALQLSDEERLFPRWVAWLGLVSCLFLAFWVDVKIWLVGLGLLGVGLAWHGWRRRVAPQSHSRDRGSR